MSNMYLISVSNRQTFNAEGFHKFVKKELYPEHISGWWHYIIGTTYIVKTELTAKELSEKIRKFTGDINHLVIKVDPDDLEGLLPARAWDWLGVI